MMEQVLKHKIQLVQKEEKRKNNFDSAVISALDL
jgi:hypothetical protein